jgi:hypothetical protein
MKPTTASRALQSLAKERGGDLQHLRRLGAGEFQDAAEHVGGR